MTKINIGIDKIEKIYHISDIHIRNLKRHQEYRIVFNRTIDAIKKTLTKNDIIFLGGDIVHAKTDMTPELIQAVQEFFKQFADIAPTILITGNHDCNLNNKSRLDALTPIVNALNHPNLFYLKDSGIYEIADKHFVVMSVFDKPKDFIRASSFSADYKIALHHGAVNNAMTDIGFRLQNDHVDIDLFDDFELVLLGDIHKPNQSLQEYSCKELDAGSDSNKKIKRIKPSIKYSGSLIQQGFAEALHHGILVWDTATRQSEFVEIINDICYYTLEVDAGKFDAIPKELLDKTIRLRIKSKNTESADLKKIVAKVKAKFTIEEYTIQKINDFSVNKSRVDRINIGDVRDVEYQNELISKFLDNKFALEDDMLDGIRHVNRTVNSGLPNLEVRRHISWIPKRFEFSNMFSYGVDNLIDFTNMKGVYGLFAPNASGKSTMLDAITFCIFDKCGRTSKAINVLNNKATQFKCEFEFELDGKQYFIKKIGTKGRGEHVRVDVDFYSINVDGEKESHNGKERSETNDNIRSILGTYEDFVLTALSVQNNNAGFIDMAQKDRKDLLSQFLDINIFEDLYNIANNDIKEVATLLKEYQRQDFGSQLAQAVSDIDLYSKEHKVYQIDKASIERQLTELNDRILDLTAKIVPIDDAIEDIMTLLDLKLKVESIISQIKTSLSGKSVALTQIDSSVDSVRSRLNTFDITDIQHRTERLNTLMVQERELNIAVEKLKTEVRHKLDKMEKLNDLQYDENCEFCMNNIFVKDAINTKSSIESDKQAAAELVSKLNLIKTQITELQVVLEEKEKFSSLQTEIHQAESQQAVINSEIHQLESKQHQAELKLEQVTRQIEEYYKKETTIQSNKQLRADISILNEEVNELKEKLSILNDDILRCHSNILLAEKTKERCEESIAKLKDLTKQYKFYEYYMQAVSRDGVPYDLITTAVPFIEQEINNILTQIVDFNLMLEMDGKNINCYIVYDNDNFWPIELTSGMEKFISSLAIRTALINVSSLPRPNFLAIDEGFGSLDSDNLNSMFNLFDYLKSQFSFMMVISHIDSMRDIVDSLIEIVKINGNSKISYM